MRYCKSCKEPLNPNERHGSLCKHCFVYFKGGGTENEIPPAGQITYDYRGYPICHICGRAYNKLGNHVSFKHHIPTDEYKSMFGLCKNSKLYSDVHKDKIVEMHKKVNYSKYLYIVNMGRWKYIKPHRTDGIRLQELNKMKRSIKTATENNKKKYKATNILTDEVTTFDSQIELTVGINCTACAITRLLQSKNPGRAFKGKYLIEEIKR